MLMPVELSLGRRAPAVIIIARVMLTMGCPAFHWNLPLAEPEPPDPSGLMWITGTVRVVALPNKKRPPGRPRKRGNRINYSNRSTLGQLPVTCNVTNELTPRFSAFSITHSGGVKHLKIEDFNSSIRHYQCR